MCQWRFFVFYLLSGLEATEKFVVVNLGLQNLLIGARGGVIGPIWYCIRIPIFLPGFALFVLCFFVQNAYEHSRASRRRGVLETCRQLRSCCHLCRVIPAQADILN